MIKKSFLAEGVDYNPYTAQPEEFLYVWSMRLFEGEEKARARTWYSSATGQTEFIVDPVTLPTTSGYMEGCISWFDLSKVEWDEISEMSS